MPNNEQAIIDMYYKYAGQFIHHYVWEHLPESIKQEWRDHYARTHSPHAVSQEEEDNMHATNDLTWYAQRSPAQVKSAHDYGSKLECGINKLRSKIVDDAIALDEAGQEWASVKMWEYVKMLEDIVNN